MFIRFLVSLLIIRVEEIILGLFKIYLKEWHMFRILLVQVICFVVIGTVFSATEWVNNITYEQGDTISYNGENYVAERFVFQNTPPKDSDFGWFWNCISGDQTGDEWSSTKDYTEGDIVKYNSKMWIAINNVSQGEIPSDASVLWEPVVLQNGRIIFEDEVIFKEDVRFVSNALFSKNVDFSELNLYSGFSTGSFTHTLLPSSNVLKQQGTNYLYMLKLTPYKVSISSTKDGATSEMRMDASELKIDNILSKRITCGELIVTDDAWADYVFKREYQLKPLSEVKAFINENGHLPGIPSEAEVKENGVNMGEMQVKLLEKIEEMTLHMIELEKKVTELEAERM